MMTGKTVSHYKVGQRLGAGGMGEVFQAEDIKLGRRVALKFLPIDLVGDEQAVKRFLWEARSLSALNHPNICTVYEVDEHEGRPFIAMELIEGQALNGVINGRSLTTDLILTLATQIADGLEAAHQQGLLHRDIKPANIFVTRRNQAKILDFGLAKLAHDVQYHGISGGPGAHAARDLTTTAGITMGTVAYMSPEQARGEELDRRSDLFSFGLVLYEMATGRQTFTGHTTAVIFDGILNREPVPAGQLNPALPAELDRIISRALEKDRELRYQSASDLRADLQRLRREYVSGRRVASSGTMQKLRENGTLPPVTSPVPVAPPATAAAQAVAAMSSAPQAEASAPSARLRTGRSPIVWLAAGVIVVVAGTGAWLAWRGHPRPSAPAEQPAPTSAAPAAAPATAAPVTETTALSSDATGREAGTAKPEAASATADTGRAEAPKRETRTAAEERELAAARSKFAAKQFDQASADLKAFVAKHPGSALAPDASLLLAEAIAAQPGRELDAITLFGDVASRYPNSSRAPEALFYRASLQDRLKLRESDRALGATVPASLVTYRTMADRFPRAVLSQHALFRMAGMYEDLERYDLAAQTFEKLGASFPASSYDGWFRAGELYERRLKDQAKARAAYLHVPPTSPRYKDAQKRAGR
jgi:serine/threonine protein kinase/outer membrane protein assembly factor BamD (BamD/ComL family)